jgi:hypothetical protein
MARDDVMIAGEMRESLAQSAIIARHSAKDTG